MCAILAQYIQYACHVMKEEGDLEGEEWREGGGEERRGGGREEGCRGRPAGV